MRKRLPRPRGASVAAPTALAAIRQSEAQYRLLFESASNPIAVFDRAGVFLMVNQVGARNLGRPASEIVGRSLREFLPAGFASALVRYQRVIDQGESLQVEDCVTLPEGERWFWSTMEPVRDLNGQIHCVQVISYDVTERKRAEAALRELLAHLELRVQERAAALAASDTALRVNVERLRLAEQASHDGIWDWNILTGDAYLSPRWKEILGFKPDELSDGQSSFFDRLHPDDRAAVARQLTAHLERDEPYQIEARLRHKSGRYRWILGRGQAIRDATGRAVRMVGSIADITERKQAERRVTALSELGRKLNSATTHREAAKCALDVAQELLGWDACFVELYAPPHNELVPVILMDTMEGRIQEFSFDKERQRARRQVKDPPTRARLVLRQSGLVSEEVLRPFGDTTRRSASLLFAPIYSKDRVIGVFSIQSYTYDAYAEPALETVQMLADHCGGAFDRILAQAALRDSEARFAAFMDFLPAFAYIKDTEGRHLFVNRFLVESIGLGFEHWIGRRLSEVIPGQQALASERNDQLLLSGGKPQVYEEQLTERGKSRTYLSSKFPIPQADGSTLLGGVSFEITEQRQAEREREHLLEQVQSARSRLEQLSRRLLEVQESERRRLARELHDQIGQAITAVQIRLQTAARNAFSENVRTSVNECLGMLDELVQLTQHISLNLRPSILDDLGLEAALRWLTERQMAPAGLRGKFQPVPLEGRLQPDIETACFRVAQEAITNIVRHAHAREFVVSLRRDGDWLALSVHDDGVGFDPAARLKSTERYKDLGLLGMEERMALVGGRLGIHSAAGAGTTVNAWFPLKWSEAAPEFE